VLVPVVIAIVCVVGVQLPAAYLGMLVLQTLYYKLVWQHQKIERLV